MAYAYPVGAGTVGQAKGVTLQVSDTASGSDKYTPTVKTVVNSIQASNNLGTILPISLYVKRSGSSTGYLVAKNRVLTTTWVVQQLVSGDSRAQYQGDPAQTNIITATEIVLNAGDSLYATSAMAGHLTLIINAQEGIN